MTLASGPWATAVLPWTCGLLTPVIGQASPPELPAPWGPALVWSGVSIVLGVFAYLFLTGRWVSARELTRETSRADQAERQREELVKQTMSETIPLISEVQRTMVPTLERLTAEVARMGERIDRLEQRQSTRG